MVLAYIHSNANGIRPPFNQEPLLLCLQLYHIMRHIIDSFDVQQTRFIIRVDCKYK
jgi:hypothetical protein